MEFPRNNYLILIYRMANKIKVVEMNTSNPEAVVEQVQETDPTPMQEEIPQPESPKEPVIIPDSVLEEPKAKKPRQPRQPREPKPPKEQKLVREPRAKKVQEPPPSESDSINTEEMIEVIKNHRASKKQPQAEAAPPPPPPPPTAKEDEKATCPHCHKVMSAKSLKYAHAKNCRAQPPAKEEESRADFMLKAIEAEKNKQIAKAVEHPISVLLAAERAMRMGQRRERIQTLLSNAF